MSQSQNEEEDDKVSVGKSRTKNVRKQLKRLSANLSPMQSKEWKNIFELYDVDKNGFIDKKELKVMVAKLQGKKPKDEEVEKLLNEFDMDGDGMIGFNEFCVMMSRGLNEEEEEAEAKRVFERLDKNSKGALDKKDLSKMFQQCGLRLSQIELDEAFELLDVDKDGMLNVEEFIKAYHEYSVKS